MDQRTITRAELIQLIQSGLSAPTDKQAELDSYSVRQLEVPCVFVYADTLSEESRDEWKPQTRPALPPVCVEMFRSCPDVRFVVALPFQGSYSINENGKSRRIYANVEFIYWNERDYDEENIDRVRRISERQCFELVVDTHQKLFHRHIAVATTLCSPGAGIVLKGQISKFVMEEVERHANIMILQ